MLRMLLARRLISLLELERLATYHAKEETTVEQCAKAANEGDEKEEAAGCQTEVAGPVVALNGKVLDVDPKARVAAHPKRHGEQERAQSLKNWAETSG